jgi:dTDP-4-amino-4,6-dideoxygalactose transaminase
LTDNEDLASLMRGFINCDRGLHDPWYHHYRLGSNYRMTEFQAALLLVQLGRVEEQTARRTENGEFLNEQLSQISGIHVLRWDERVTRRSHHLYQMRYAAEEFGGPSRDRFVGALNAEGIPCWGGYCQPLYRHSIFQRSGDGPEYCPLSCPYYARRMDYTKVNCPNAERICREAVTFGQRMLLGTREDMADVVRAFHKIYDNRSAL